MWLVVLYSSTLLQFSSEFCLGLLSVMAENLYSKVELSVSCSNLKDLDHFSKSDPVVFLFEKRGREWIPLGRTEVIDNNLNPKVKDTAPYIYRI